MRGGRVHRPGAAHGGATGSRRPSREVIAAFVRLRWRLLRGSFRSGGAEQAGAVLGTIAALLVGGGVGTFLAIAATGADDLTALATVACTVVLAVVIGFGVVAGVAQPLDPRVIAVEALTDRERAIGLLAAAAAGPAGLAGALLGTGLLLGSTRGAVSAPIVLAAVVSWLLALLLVARTATNLLGVLTSRFPRTGQLVAGFAALGFYALFQLTPAAIANLDPDERTRLASALRWTPTGQLGHAIGAAGDRPGIALTHVALGSIWLPLLAIAFTRSTQRLAGEAQRERGVRSSDPLTAAPGRAIRRLCGDGAVGAIAWRSLLTRFRTPRTLMETFVGSGLGLAAVLVPTLTRDTPGSGAVLVGGAVQLAVVFVAGNSFGVDGPAIAHELLAGAGPDDLVRGKARAAAIVAAPLAVAGPAIGAAATGEWRFLAAGLGVGIGALLAGSGAAVVQSAFVPIAIPDTDNPFAGGESGKGVLAALLLGAVLACLAIATVPVALALLWAIDRGAVALVTLFGAATIAVGRAVQHLGIAVATRRLRGDEHGLVAAVTPSR